MRIVLAFVLSILLCPVAALAGVALLARASGRLTRWHSEGGGSEFMFSMPVGGFGWQVISAFTRALAVFGVARLVFWLLGVPPSAYCTVVLILMLFVWDVHRWRTFVRPTLSSPPRAIAVAQFKVGVGLAASIMAGLLFLLR